ncbi:MAG: hypothetical protein GY856_27055, partial [bacterium]|nr:hypothetical protein [bacterium]
MSDRNVQSPMLASSTESVATAVSTRPAGASTAEVPPPHADPDAVVDKILSLLDEDRFQAARCLAREAAARFPDHPRVRNAQGLFDNRGKARVRPGNEPGSDQDFQWLRQPPSWARGKWVALVDGEAVASA